MGILRCTAKYRKAMGLPDGLGEPSAPSSSALGEWYANTLNIGALRLLQYHSDRSRLSVVLRLSPRKTAESRFVDSLGDLLRQLGVPPTLVNTELRTLLPFTYSRARDRSVLSTLRDHARGVKSDLEHGRAHTPWDLSWRLAETPCGPLKGRSPDRVAPELLQRAFGHS